MKNINCFREWIPEVPRFQGFQEFQVQYSVFKPRRGDIIKLVNEKYTICLFRKKTKPPTTQIVDSLNKFTVDSKQ